ncbi:MAG: transcription-repair coupling factor, partial [Mariniphaga sp.]|nr:transcription-repair coupling factor [Mariniphaga sp.]
EYFLIEYGKGDKLYIPTWQADRISKYIGSRSPSITSLDSKQWDNLKKKVRRSVQKLAVDLARLYAERQSITGYSFPKDSAWQSEIEQLFPFTETPDQIKAIEYVKKAMEGPRPMDVLVVGDVGFGKTEVAIRAAFKAVADSKQVAVLVPTTILALQHFKTFTERLEGFPATIAYISRLRSTAEIKQTLKEVQLGKIDIIIGTHRLVSKDVEFKDLGLLIIDEEQKFGVSVKEKLKQFKINVDTLTLTATPIPRTLQFSLMGARDLSIIQTAPPNRYPIETETHGFNEQIIKDAIIYEVERNGQVFFIHNRIQNINEVEATLKRIVPGVKTTVAHGQMDGSRLEKVMLGFINGDFDVLIATTIIESGLDIPNANTIIINQAQNFGLSDLHQLRGRVGRSNKKAFCYLITPPLSTVSSEARRRLKAIEEFSDLGSGFNIAMQDLDIRGAGNMLGAEQSGFIADIGFDTYHRILNEAIQELKQGEFKPIFEKEDSEAVQTFLKVNYVSDCQIDTDLEILFPDEYIQGVAERMFLYRKLDNIEDEEELLAFTENLIDRFGKIPPQTSELLNVVRLRWQAIKLGIEKIILKENKMICYLISDQESTFYKSTEFMKIIQAIQHNQVNCRIKEIKNKLSLIFKETGNVSKAREVLDKLLESVFANNY